MDGSLTDSIAAIEVARGNVAREIGEDPAREIAATHGKCSIDNRARFKPHLRPHEPCPAVEEFERSLLFSVDAHRRACASAGPMPSLRPSDTDAVTGTNSSSGPCSRMSSLVPSVGVSTERLLARPHAELADADADADELADALSPAPEGRSRAWGLEADGVDGAVRILPGVKALLESIPTGRYAIATSGTRTHAHGRLARVDIIPPNVTITVDDRRLCSGEPALEPFLLAAERLGYSASRCVVFEDSPSGIRAGVAAGAIVIAACTRHSREQIEQCGAHLIVENWEDVRCEEMETEDGTRLMFTVEH
ncbi:HAD-like domain-containing protein [Russula earlei]|uniref:HAD-like domain-containing protein n=1 Tax=Russula earlei TaxID=71964 RepID=A0ACC0U069_9AGAM|nr:HAD-like domain-containing protein [Russula earlei]